MRYGPARKPLTRESTVATVEKGYAGRGASGSSLLLERKVIPGSSPIPTPTVSPAAEGSGCRERRAQGPPCPQELALTRAVVTALEQRWIFKGKPYSRARCVYTRVIYRVP
jgi:hypothetical protein